MSVLDTLEICFQANLDGVDAQLDALSGNLNAVSAASLRADLGLRAAELPQASAMGSAQSAEQALENVNLTIPIHVDGMKLGEASIRGINAVTRSAGRLLLNL